MENYIADFDVYLFERGLSFSGIVVGGAALILSGTVNRATDDVDVIAPELPDEIVEVAHDFAIERSTTDHKIRVDWLNNGPSSLVDVLPAGWREDVKLLYQGRAITFYQLGRLDTLRTKLFAYCDRSTDLNDCIALQPTENELQEITPWLAKQDANPQWPSHVERSLRTLQRELDKSLSR